MSMVHCPECGHEVSVSAVACPNCGRPLNETPPVIERKVVVPPRTMRDTGIPSWALIPVGILVVVLLFLGYLVFRQSNEEANTNVNINVASRRTPAGSASESRTVTPPTSEPQPVVPPTTDSQTTSVPQITTVPGSRTAPVVSPADKGTAVINVRVTPPRGAAQSVRNTRFYLLDKDVEAILDEARVEPIEGNTLAGSLGLAVVYPDRYSDFQQRAMRAIAAHAKYSGTTDGSGTANVGGIIPKEYYLFGITRVGKGFALWDAPVSVTPGQNIINLGPQSVTEVADTSG